MTFQIRTPAGEVFTVHTEVGDGLTRVVIDEDHEPVKSLDCSDEEPSHG